MPGNPKFGNALTGIVCLAVLLMPQSTLAVTAEVAKKCSTLMAKKFPPRIIGNPAAGSTKGTPEGEREYFNQCVQNGGNMGDDDTPNTKDGAPKNE
jgi:hypothetical protein